VRDFVHRTSYCCGCDWLLSKRHSGHDRHQARVARNEVAAVAAHAVVDHDVVVGACRARGPWNFLGGLAELLRSVEARDVSAAVKVRSIWRQRGQLSGRDAWRCCLPSTTFGTWVGAAYSPCSPSCCPWRGRVVRGRHRTRAGRVQS
jgi:hypothetical protein